MTTYIYLIVSGPLVKIGKSNSLTARMESFKLHNPHAALIGFAPQDATSGFTKKALHTKFKSFQHYSEWFRFDESIVEEVLSQPGAVQTDFKEVSYIEWKGPNELQNESITWSERLEKLKHKRQRARAIVEETIQRDDTNYKLLVQKYGHPSDYTNWGTLYGYIKRLSAKFPHEQSQNNFCAAVFGALKRDFKVEKCKDIPQAQFHLVADVVEPILREKFP